MARAKYHKATSSLDRLNGFEKDVINKPKTPEDIVIENETKHDVNEALKKLTKVQHRRVVLYYWENMSCTDIAKLEGVDESAVRHSIEQAHNKLEKLLNGKF